MLSWHKYLKTILYCQRRQASCDDGEQLQASLGVGIQSRKGNVKMHVIGPIYIESNKIILSVTYLTYCTSCCQQHLPKEWIELRFGGVQQLENVPILIECS